VRSTWLTPALAQLSLSISANEAESALTHLIAADSAWLKRNVFVKRAYITCDEHRTLDAINECVTAYVTSKHNE
jgi:hypothetical protein